MMTRLGLACLVTACLAGMGIAQESVRLEERLREGHRYGVRMRVEVNGTLTPPAVKGKKSNPVKLDGTSNIDYEERVLAVDARGNVTKALRISERLEFRRNIAGQQQELALRPEVRRLVVLRKGHTEVPFSPDGPLTWGEIDAVRTDVFVPALLGLLPGRSVLVGDRWTASNVAIEELTDLDKIENGTLDCKLERLSNVGRRQFARVTFSGTIRGVGEDGPVQHRLQGQYTFDVEGQYLADLTLLGTTTMQDSDGKSSGRIDGRLVLTRTLDARSNSLSDDAVRGLKSEPDADNTMMLYNNSDLGVKFLYSRRWRVAQVMGAQVALATNEGDGILITVDPSESVPTATAFLEETQRWLQKQKGKLLRTYTPKRLRDTPPLDAFALEAELGRERFWMDYFVTAQSGGGATVAARMRPDGLTETRREADRIARSVTITKRITSKMR